MVFSGKSPDGVLPEIVEIPDHPWYIGVQFHPELKSRPFEPHPLFTDFIRRRRTVPVGITMASHKTVQIGNLQCQTLRPSI